MKLQAKSGTCPKDRGLAVAFGKGDFRCTVCDHTFPAKRGNKFGAVSSVVAGVKFDSNDEKSFILVYLALRETAGEVRDIVVKPKYIIEPGVSYVPEVTYFDIAEGTRITVDVKGKATRSNGRFPTIKRIWKNHMDHPLHVVERDENGRWVTKQKITPRQKDG
ncbi:MAG: hypothetical protein ABIW76_17220 [Fibrobacteria bacterium]